MTDQESKATDTPQEKPSHSMSRTAYERIETLLNCGTLHPGQVVSQRELVDMTGATLGSIRIAIPRLEAEGLLQTLPKRGLMVPSLDVAFVRDAYQLRHMIEVGAIEYAATSLQPGQIAAWIERHETLLDSLVQGHHREVSDELQTLDWAMHESIVAAMGNKLIDNTYRVTLIKTRMVVQSRLQITSDNARRVLEEHLAFLRPLANRDIDSARAALSRHISNSLDLALSARN
ncbi:GntR family transcriptional regulator [Halomonas sp. IOP_14]|uniref:GntR family transcriptional regulator n=1 Tax=Halomonadaceae TaxID=28256 RepID=UPI001AD79FAB|nr:MULTISPECIES: GntR family transcriptional regulator [Halomonas]MCD1588531.1 GntR family transcriptional regulator [Halomonas sp. IOP_14]